LKTIYIKNDQDEPTPVQLRVLRKNIDKQSPLQKYKSLPLAKAEDKDIMRSLFRKEKHSFVAHPGWKAYNCWVENFRSRSLNQSFLQ